MSQQVDLGKVRASVTVGTTTLGAYGNGVSVTNSGDSQDAVLDFTIPASVPPITNHGTSDTTFTLTPNVYHLWGTVSSLILTLGTPVSDMLNEYMFEFTAGQNISFASISGVQWAESIGDLTPEAGKRYQVSIVNNLGVWVSVTVPTA